MADDDIKEPVKPGLNACCGGSCAPCVWDIYYAELEKWRNAQSNIAEQQTADNKQE